MELFPLSTLIFGYVVAMNLLALGLFWYDKRAAQRRQWRVSEATLLGVSLLGGSIGSLFAQNLFRHKTRKQPFKTYLYIIIAIQILLGLTMLTPNGRQAVLQMLHDALG